jgi:outer membrane protein
MPTCSRSFNNTNNNYIQGLAALTDLLDAENAMVEAQNNYTMQF